MRKSIAIIVLTALMLQIFGICAFATPYVDEAEFNTLTKKLTAFGVISSVTHEWDDLVTRGEFIDAVAGLFNLDTTNGEQIFYDVHNTNQSFGAVYAAYKMGVISLPDDRCFNPHANIKYAEAAKILVSMLGYSEKANALGGYPTGYLTLASNLKLGLESYRDGISYYNMLVAFENMTKVKIPVMDSIESGSVTYETYADRTLLSEYHHIHCDEGVVEAVGVSSIYGDDTLSSDKTSIGGNTYFFDFEELPEFIGCEVDFYYFEEDNKKTVIYAELIDDGDVLDIPAEDIIEFKDSVYTYYRENGKKDTAKVVSVPFVMYNGKTATGKNKDMYTPVSGSVRLVNSVSGGAYDVIIIKDYKTYVVEAVDAENSIIYGKYGLGNKLDFDETKDIDAKITTVSGKDVFVGVIGEWNIISALVSEDGKYVRAIVTTESVSGAISGYSNNAGTEIVEINGKQYTIAKSMALRNEEVPKTGTEVVCYLDHEGKIAAISNSESLGYRYYILLQYDKNSGLSKDAMIQVMNSDNEIEEYILSEKTKVDGVSYKTVDEQYEAIENGFNAGRIVRMKVIDGVLYDIDTPYVSDREYKESSISLYMPKTEEMLYKSSGNLEDTFYINDNTFIVFEYPGEKDISKRFFAAKRSMLTADTRYIATSYAVGETFTPQAVIFESSSSSGNVSDRTLYTITDKSKTADSDGEMMNKFLLNNGSVAKTLYADDEQVSSVGGLDVGDVIRVDIYKENYVLSNFIRKIYDYSSDTVIDTNLESAGTNSSIAIKTGYVYDKIDSYMSYALTDNKANIENADKLVTSIPANIVKISRERDNVLVESASAGDLKDYKAFNDNCSKILIKYQYRVPYELIIIER